MFEDWSPHGQERRAKAWEDADLYRGHRQHAPVLTRSQLRHARRVATVLGVAVVTFAFAAWRALVLQPAQALGRAEIGAPDWQRLLGTGPEPPAAAAAAAGPVRPAALVAAPGATVLAAPSHDAGEVGFNATKLQALDHLVLVAGHAVVLAEALDGVDMHDAAWYLEHYQRDQDLPNALVGHIRRGVEAAAEDPRALLVFSGGQTRPAAGPRDEGSSYYRVAEHYNWWGHTAVRSRGPLALRHARARGEESPLPVPQRTVTEDFAADSFQNLLFSLCRFREVVGRYPARVTVVSFTFKRRRFEDLHRAALRFPLNRFTFLGLQPPAWSRFDLAEAERGERENAARSYEEDPYGCHTPALAAKRDARNPFRRTTPYPLSCTDIRALLEWCGPGLFPKTLPWSSPPGLGTAS